MAGWRRQAGIERKSEVPAQVAPVEGAPDVSGPRFEDLLERVAQPTLPAIERPFVLPSEPPSPALRTARIARMVDAGVEIFLRGRAQPVIAAIDEGVDRELITQAMENGDALLVESGGGQDPIVLGVVRTRAPAKLTIKADEVVIDADREVLIRAGRAALRIRDNGDVEVLGSRILTISRGLFRIVGRVLRMN